MPERWIDVVALEQVPGDRPLGLVVEGVSLALVRRGEMVVAVADRCPHQTFPLRHGRIHEGQLVCALHGWKFAVFEPDAQAIPPEARCTRYPTRVRDGRVEVELGP